MQPPQRRNEFQNVDAHIVRVVCVHPRVCVHLRVGHTLDLYVKKRREENRAEQNKTEKKK